MTETSVLLFALFTLYVTCKPRVQTSDHGDPDEARRRAMQRAYDDTHTPSEE